MTLSSQEALIHLMVIAASSDAALSDRELEVIGTMVTRLPVFSGFNREELGQVAAVDLQLEQEELRLLEMIRDGLNLDGLVAAAIEASAKARLRKA